MVFKGLEISYIYAWVVKEGTNRANMSANMLPENTRTSLRRISPGFSFAAAIKSVVLLGGLSLVD